MLELVERGRPELIEELADGSESFRADGVEAALALRSYSDQAGLAQDLQVLRDRLLGDVEVGGDLVDRARLLAHEHQDRPSTRLAQRGKRRLGTHAAKVIKGTSCTSANLCTLFPVYQEACMPTDSALDAARCYHQAWTSRNYERAAALLAATLTVEVPINDYPSKESFAGALRSFGDLVTRVDLLAEMSAANEAMLLYDLTAEQLGTLRVAEHFTIENGKIVRLRQIHDTAPVRAWLAASTPAGAHAS